MNITLHADLVRRSIDNHLIIRRRNHREDKCLEQTFSLYQRQHRLIDYAIRKNEHRFEQHAREDLGFVVTHKLKPFQCSEDHPLHYTLSNRNCMMKEYSVESSCQVRRNPNSSERIHARRSRQYADELKEKLRLQKLRQENLMNEVQVLIEENATTNDLPSSDYARIKLPPMDMLI